MFHCFLSVAFSDSPPPSPPLALWGVWCFRLLRTNVADRGHHMSRDGYEFACFLLMLCTLIACALSLRPPLSCKRTEIGPCCRRTIAPDVSDGCRGETPFENAQNCTSIGNTN